MAIKKTALGRVLIITDRTELDEQIEKVFKGVDEDIYRTRSGTDLLIRLADPNPWQLCSLVHKFGLGEDASTDKNCPLIFSRAASFLFLWTSATAPGRASCTRP